MRTRWNYYEPCCGSAAVALHLVSAKRALLPFQGSKWRHRHGIERLIRDALRSLGEVTDEPPHRIVLADSGPWGRVAPLLFDATAREAIVDRLRVFARLDPRGVYDALHGHPVSRVDRVGYAAEFLFLQRLAFSGKAVQVRDGRWAAPGFNTTSAYGKEATERFGKISPMVPSLIRTLESYSRDLDKRLAIHAIDVRSVIQAGPGSALPTGKNVVYLDPPYVGTTPYTAHDMTRDQVVVLARGWHQTGARVIVSEAGPVGELVASGAWHAHRLSAGRGDTSRFRGQHEEWVTINWS